MQIHEITLARKSKQVDEGILDGVKTAINVGKQTAAAAKAGAQGKTGAAGAWGALKGAAKAMTSNDTLKQASADVHSANAAKHSAGAQAQLDKKLGQEAQNQVKQWMTDWSKKKPIIQKQIDDKFPAHNSAEAHVSDDNPNIGLGMNEAGVPVPNADGKDNSRIADEFKRLLGTWMQQKLGGTPEEIIKKVESMASNADSVEQQQEFKNTAETLKKQLDAALLYPPQDANIQAFLGTAALTNKKLQSLERIKGQQGFSTSSSGARATTGSSEEQQKAQQEILQATKLTQLNLGDIKRAIGATKVRSTGNERADALLNAAGIATQ